MNFIKESNQRKHQKTHHFWAMKACNVIILKKLIVIFIQNKILLRLSIMGGKQNY